MNFRILQSLMDPRPHHFEFKRELCSAFLSDPKHFFTSSRGGAERANAYLKGIWTFVGKKKPPALDPTGLGLAKHIQRPEVEVSVVAFPKAAAPNEAYFVATTMRGAEHAVFAYERDIMGEAVLVKVHGGGRANLGFFSDITLDGFLQALEGKLGVPLREAAKPAARAPDALGLPAFQGPSAFDLAEAAAAKAAAAAAASPAPASSPVASPGPSAALPVAPSVVATQSPSAAAAPGKLPKLAPTPADLFLGGLLPHLVAYHFDSLDVVLRCKGSGPDPLARAVDVIMGELPKAGPEVVSRVMALESLVIASGHEVLPPPKSGTELEGWAKHVRKAVLSTLDVEKWKPLAATGGEVVARAILAAVHGHHAYQLGQRLGELLHDLLLITRCHQLLSVAPDHDFLKKQHEALEASRASCSEKLRATLTDEAFKAALGEAWISRIGATLAAADPKIFAAREAARGGTRPWPAARAARVVGFAARSVVRLLKLSATPLAGTLAALASDPTDSVALANVLAHPDWRMLAVPGPGAEPGDVLPGRGAPPLSSTTPAGVTVYFYSCLESQMVTGSPGPWVVGDGGTLIDALPPEVAAIALDGGARGEIRLAGEPMARLRKAARGTAIEYELTDWATIDREVLRRHAGWVVPLRAGEVAPLVVKDELDRTFFGVFSDRAAASLFATTAGKLPEGAAWGEIDAEKMLDAAERADAYGIWFNPKLGARGRRFSKGFVKLLRSGE